jgi:transcriptional accessory protein Tex/SPT6
MAYRKKRSRKNKPQEIDEQVLQKLNSELDKLKELFEERRAAIVKANSNLEYFK